MCIRGLHFVCLFLDVSCLLDPLQRHHKIVEHVLSKGGKPGMHWEKVACLTSTTVASHMLRNEFVQTQCRRMPFFLMLTGVQE